MKKRWAKVFGIKIRFKKPENRLSGKDRYDIYKKIKEGIISDTFDGLGWWIISKYNL
jgi:hypothetical protein